MQNGPRLFLKILLKQDRPIVKVDTFDADAPPPEAAEVDIPPLPPEDEPAVDGTPSNETAPNQLRLFNPKVHRPISIFPPQATKPSAPFYESSVFLNTLSSLLFLGLGFFAGDRFRKMKPSPPLRWFYLGNGKPSEDPAQSLLIGQRQCWSCSEDLDRLSLLSLLVEGLKGAGPILVLTAPSRHGPFIQVHRGQPGIFVTTEVPCRLAEVEKQVHQLKRIEAPLSSLTVQSHWNPPRATKPKMQSFRMSYTGYPRHFCACARFE